MDASHRLARIIAPILGYLAIAVGTTDAIACEPCVRTGLEGSLASSSRILLGTVEAQPIETNSDSNGAETNRWRMRVARTFRVRPPLRAPRAGETFDFASRTLGMCVRKAWRPSSSSPTLLFLDEWNTVTQYCGIPALAVSDSAT